MKTQYLSLWVFTMFQSHRISGVDYSLLKPESYLVPTATVRPMLSCACACLHVDSVPLSGSNSAQLVSTRLVMSSDPGLTPSGRSPLFGDVLALSHPGALEVVAELVPEHEDGTWHHFLLSRFCLHTKVAHHVLETGAGRGGRVGGTQDTIYVGLSQ